MLMNNPNGADLNALAVEAANGDRDAIRRFWDAFKPIAVSVARQANVPGYAAEDLVSEAGITVCERIRFYDPNRGSAVSFLKKAIRNRFTSLTREQLRPKRMILHNAAALSDAPDASLASGRLGCGIENGVCLRDLMERFGTAIQQEIINRLARGEQRPEIAAALGIAPEQVRREIDVFRGRIKNFVGV